MQCHYLPTLLYVKEVIFFNSQARGLEFLRMNLEQNVLQMLGTLLISSLQNAPILQFQGHNGIAYIQGRWVWNGDIFWLTHFS